jgi:hypothetical protein
MCDRQPGDYLENSPQGLKPTLLFSDVFGTAEAVPCYQAGSWASDRLTGDYPENSPQGLKPTLLFSDVFGTTEEAAEKG